MRWMPVPDTSCMMMHISMQSDNRATIFFDLQIYDPDEPSHLSAQPSKSIQN